jgi:GAF domain-containing protein
MFAVKRPPSGTKAELHSELRAQAGALFEGERDLTANAANLAALIFHTLPDLNWAGFYWLKGGELVLGPLPGQARLRSHRARQGGVRHGGASAAHDRGAGCECLPGHIACDSASRSEVVVPVMVAGRVAGVLDLDSPIPARFDDEDARALESLVAAFVAATDMGS